MKRKQWLAMILALGMLLSLVPVFSASASELEDGQIIADGIYYIRNWEFNTFLKLIDKKETENYDMYDYLYPGFYYAFHEEYHPPYSNSQTSLTEMDARFLWKVEYIGNGQYAISSMYITDFMLTPGHELEGDYGVPLGTMDFNRNIDGNVSNRAKWIIKQYGRGYILQWIGDNAEVYGAEDPREYPLPFVMGDNPHNSGAFEWEFIPAPEQIMFYSSGGTFKENPVYFVAPEQTLTLEELGLGVMLSPDFSDTNNITWSSSNGDVADVCSVDGEVTGISYGECTITATYRKEGRPPISKSYTLKVAPLPEGTYHITNKASGYCIEASPSAMEVLLDSVGTTKTQRWYFEHIEKDEYRITIETDSGLFYLGCEENQADGGMDIKIFPVEDGTRIPCWEVGVTSEGSYTLSYESNDALFAKRDCTVSNYESEVVLGNYTDDDNEDDEWVIERVCLLRVYVYYDEYVSAYGDSETPWQENIREQLRILEEMYWIEFGIIIDVLGWCDVDTLIEQCGSFQEMGKCSHDPCRVSDDFERPSSSHHTNLLNILMHLGMPPEPADAIIAYIGHETCGFKNGEHMWNAYDGYAFPRYGIVGINDIWVYNERTDKNEYNQNHCTMTLFHEVGHLFYAKDHYGQYENGRPITTEEINRTDYEFAGMYSDQCIYSERRHGFDDPTSLPFCDGCRGNIMANKYRYYA